MILDLLDYPSIDLYSALCDIGCTQCRTVYCFTDIRNLEIFTLQVSVFMFQCSGSNTSLLYDDNFREIINSNLNPGNFDYLKGI